MHPQELRIQDFTYNLPDERIAHHPLEERDASKLLVYRRGEPIQTNPFRSLATCLDSDSVLVFNNTKVIHARLLFAGGNGARIEVFCLEPIEDSGLWIWRCMVGNAKRWKPNEVLHLEQEDMRIAARLVGREEDLFIVAFELKSAVPTGFDVVLEQLGKIPLPPYIKRQAGEADQARYQTVYAQHKGSVAAPTAGLHFTERVLSDLDASGIKRMEVTLHVGAGTFAPVKAETMAGHIMHQERISVPRTFFEELEKQPHARLVAVGTTSLRTLETLYWCGVKVAQNPGALLSQTCVHQWEPYEINGGITWREAYAALHNYLKSNGLDVLEGQTQLLIAPGYSIKTASGLITNFHQPNSTLLLLVAACIGDDWRNVYEYALHNDYRFLSYGDSSLLWF
jgi:S-adenosylmethionine:tRNA ribosyltransferase-isomerase